MAKEVGVDRVGLGGEKQTAVWDGRELVFRESPFTLLTAARAAWRYGLRLKQLKTWSVPLSGEGRVTDAPPFRKLQLS